MPGQDLWACLPSCPASSCSCAEQCISLLLKAVCLGSVTWNWRQSDSKACSSVTSWLDCKVSGTECKGSPSQESGHALGSGNVNCGVLWSAPCKPEPAPLIWLYPSDGSYFSRQLSKAWFWNVWGKNYKATRVEPEKNPLLPREVLSWSLIRLNQGFETWNRVCLVHG